MPNYTMLDYAAHSSGCLTDAVGDVLQRLMRQFPGDVTPEEIGVALVALRKAAPHLYPSPAAPPGQPPDGVPTGMHPAVWASMLPESRLAWHRTHTPQTPVVRRPGPFTATPEQQAQVEGQRPEQRLTQARQWRDAKDGG